MLVKVGLMGFTVAVQFLRGDFMLTTRSIFTQLSGPLGEEVTSSLLKKPDLLIECIHSNGNASSEGYWYDQQEDEWVLLARGSATLDVANQDPIKMIAGDYIFIRKHLRHRVSEVSTDAVWLAIHLP